MTQMLSPTFMRVAASSVHRGLKLKFRAVKKAMERRRSATGRLTKLCLAMAEHRFSTRPVA
jgi:hypothetical protein